MLKPIIQTSRQVESCAYISIYLLCSTQSLCTYLSLYMSFLKSSFIFVCTYLFSIVYLCINLFFPFSMFILVPLFTIFLSLYVPVFSIFYLCIGTCFFYFLSLYWYLFLLFSIFECKCVFQSFVSWTFSISACNSFLFLFLHSSNAFKKIPLRRNFSQYINPFTVLNKMNSIPRRRFICADFSFTCKQLMCFFFLFSSFLSCS